LAKALINPFVFLSLVLAAFLVSAGVELVGTPADFPESQPFSRTRQ
jgi:hypothetical protein